jgi:hypothetical protein
MPTHRTVGRRPLNSDGVAPFEELVFRCCPHPIPFTVVREGFCAHVVDLLITAGSARFPASVAPFNGFSAFCSGIRNASPLAWLLMAAGCRSARVAAHRWWLR